MMDNDWFSTKGNEKKKLKAGELFSEPISSCGYTYIVRKDRYGKPLPTEKAEEDVYDLRLISRWRKHPTEEAIRYLVAVSQTEFTPRSEKEKDAGAGARKAAASGYAMLVKEKFDDTALAALADPRKISFDELGKDETVLFPFGTNFSQMGAVENALRSNLSVIEGPPGTGKTQTILTIIANMLYRGKSVLVVSGNNSAVRNVSEKLEEHGFGFLVAELGASTAWKAFGENQGKTKVVPDDLRKWKQPPREVKKAEKAVRFCAAKLKDVYLKKIELADAEQLLRNVEAQIEHIEQERTVEPRQLALRPRASSKGFSLLHSLVSRANEHGRASLGPACLLGPVLGIGRRDDYRHVDPALEEALFEEFHSALAREVQGQIDSLRRACESKRVEKLEKALGDGSLLLLKHGLASNQLAHEQPGPRRVAGFDKPKDADIRRIRNAYPVQTSTCHSCMRQVGFKASMQFDVAIIDEASQVSLDVGILGLGAARRAVVVGDSKQLAPVRPTEQVEAVPDRPAGIPERLDWKLNSLLDACVGAIEEMPDDAVRPHALLAEHYRCDPEIIGFCNERFYGGQLKVMSKPGGEACEVLTVVKSWSAARSATVNERQIRDAVQVVEHWEAEGFDASDVLLLAPFNLQVDKLARIEVEGADASTVHKSQGREKSCVIFSSVKDKPNAFLEDPRLLNVAVSRARSRLALLVEVDLLAQDCLVSDLARYMAYRGGTVLEESSRPAFPFLFGPRHGERTGDATETAAMRRICELLAEERAAEQIGVCRRYPLYLLVPERLARRLDGDLQAFVRSSSHIDLLLYDRASMMPRAAIEIDGQQHEGGLQAGRDAKKDAVMRRCGIRVVRVKTTDAEAAADEKYRAAIRDALAPRERIVERVRER